MRFIKWLGLVAVVICLTPVAIAAALIDFYSLAIDCLIASLRETK